MFILLVNEISELKSLEFTENVLEEKTSAATNPVIKLEKDVWNIKRGVTEVQDCIDDAQKIYVKLIKLENVHEETTNNLRKLNKQKTRREKNAEKRCSFTYTGKM